MKAFVQYVMRELAEHPGDIAVTEVVGRQSSILEVRCHPKDLGRLIGRSGKTIGSLRVLLSGVATRHGRKAVVEVAE